MKKSLNKITIQLIAIRPLINIFADLKLTNIMGYDVSILTIWSAFIVILIIIRLSMENDKYNKKTNSTILFIIYILLIGLPRVYTKAAIYSEVLYTIQYLLGIMSAIIISEEKDFMYLVKLLYKVSILLLIIHSTSWIWNKKSFEYLHNYIGAFRDPFIAANTFFNLIPFLYIYTKKYNTLISKLIIFSTIYFMTWTFRRTNIFAFIMGVIVLLILKKRIKFAVAIIFIFISLYYFIPRASTSLFLEKMNREYSSYEIGNIELVGSGRVKLYSLGIDEFNKSTIIEKLFGHGSASSWELSYWVWGKDMYAHGQFIATLYDYGIMGLLMLLIIILNVTINANKIRLYWDKNLGEVLMYVIISSIGIMMTNILLAAGGTNILISILWGKTLLYNFKENI